MSDIQKINKVVADYFNSNPSIESIQAKELMPEFIKAGIFEKDSKNGLPIRKVLRQLDEDNKLNLIHHLYAERKKKNTYWYFVKSANSEILPKPTKTDKVKTKAKSSSKKREDSDEYYILNLCDQILKQKGLRQHKFDFALGDLHKDGKTRSKLPYDAYYPELNLVIEYCEKQHSETVSFFDKADKMTVSGVSRGEQRKIYDLRKRKALVDNNINLIDIDYSLFDCDSRKRLIRNEAKDKKILKQLIEEKIKL